MADEQQLAGTEARAEIARKLRDVADLVESDALPALGMRDSAERVVLDGTPFLTGIHALVLVWSPEEGQGDVVKRVTNKIDLDTAFRKANEEMEKERAETDG